MKERGDGSATGVPQTTGANGRECKSKNTGRIQVQALKVTGLSFSKGRIGLCLHQGVSQFYFWQPVTIVLTFDKSCMAHSFSWTFSCCCMLFHRNLHEKQSFCQICIFWHLIIYCTINVIDESHSLDDMLQNLQTKVSHYSWLGFVG